MRHSLGRAGAQDDTVLAILGQRRRTTKAAQQGFKQRLTGLRYVPRGLLTDPLPRSAAAKREVMPGGAHRQRRSLNNRGEHSHWPPP